MHALPPWIVFHVPHDSFYIPPEVRRGILLSDAELDREFLRMTDVWTQALFAAGVLLSVAILGTDHGHGHDHGSEAGETAPHAEIHRHG